jgi:hypothetical protein
LWNPHVVVVVFSPRRLFAQAEAPLLKRPGHGKKRAKAHKGCGIFSNHTSIFHSFAEGIS